MNPPRQIVPVVVGADVSLPARKKYFSAWILLALLLTLCAARVEGQDDDYLAIYGIMARADSLNASGQTSQAHAKYIEAERALAVFQRDNPGWKASMVSYRLKYLAEKVAATSEQAAAPNATTNAAKKEGAVATTPEQAAASDNSTTAVTKQAASNPKSPVKLLDAGSEPRTVVRLHPTVGDKQTLTMTMKMAMTMSVADKPVPAMDMPAMLMTLDLGVKDISAAGDIIYEVVFTDATVVTNASTLPAVAAAVKSSLAGIRGMTGTGMMSANGIINALEMKVPAGTDPQMSQTMDQMKQSFSGSATPLPEEAVGPGARWEYTTRPKSQGMTIDQSATYELVSIAGDRLTLRSTITQNAANQKIENPAMPGLKADLDNMTGTGAGGSTLDLAHIMPTSATLDEDVEIVMGVNMGQQKQTMDMKMNVSVALEAK